MIEAYLSGYTGGAIRSEGGQGGRLCAAELLGLAAAPAFAIMAVATGLFGSQDVCSMVQGAWPLSGMVPMYLLMSAFHLSPWLKLLFRPATSPR
jgi:hypothetical protein